MKKGNIYIWMLLIIGVFSSCLKDDNNYNYTEVNELVRGGILGIKPEYKIIEGKDLTLEPIFKLTIDSINPDVSYEWYVNRKLQEGETGPTFTFKGEKGGKYSITFVLVDNKSTLRFSVSTSVLVVSKYYRGWCILSDEGGRSVLNFIVPTTVQYNTTFEEEEFIRDSLVYHVVERDVVSGLGTHPKGLYNHLGNMDYYGEYHMTVFDELVVQQDRWVELNGSTLEREVYTDEEFRGDIPEDFSPVEASMGYSSKALLDKNGLIYFGKKGDVVDFHANTYIPVGLNNNMRFSRLFPTHKLNQFYTRVTLALTEEDNSLVGIVNEGEASHNSTTITDISASHSGEVLEVNDYYNNENKFKSIKQTIIDGVSSPYEAGMDITRAEPYWALLLKNENTSDYSLRYFKLDYVNGRIVCPTFNPNYDSSPAYYEASLGNITDYRGMVSFNQRRSLVIADGNQLYYYQYGWNPRNAAPYQGKLMKLGNPLPGNIKKISGFDIVLDLTESKYPYDAQLAVALDNGDFYIFGVRETKGMNEVTTAVDLTQVYPNDQTSEANKNFGNVVDVVYKYGRAYELIDFTF